MLLILPPSSVLLTTHPRAPIVALETTSILATIRIGMVIVVIVVVLAVETHNVLLLRSNNKHNNNIHVTSNGVRLRHHGPCLCACILLLHWLAHMLLPVNKAFRSNILRLMLPQLHQHPLTLQLLCAPYFSLLLTTHVTYTRVTLPT